MYVGYITNNENLLTKKHILLRVQPDDDNKDIGFSPAGTINKLSVKTIFDALERDGVVFTGLLKECELYHKFTELDTLVDNEVDKINTTLIKEL